ILSKAKSPCFTRRLTFRALAFCADNDTRAHKDPERCTANPEDQQETPHALQEAELNFWYRIGEAYSAFRGWRPIPAALLSHSVVLVPGPKNSLPTTASPTSEAAYS